MNNIKVFDGGHFSETCITIDIVTTNINLESEITKTKKMEVPIIGFYTLLISLSIPIILSFKTGLQ